MSFVPYCSTHGIWTRSSDTLDETPVEWYRMYLAPLTICFENVSFIMFCLPVPRLLCVIFWDPRNGPGVGFFLPMSWQCIPMSGSVSDPSRSVGCVFSNRL